MTAITHPENHLGKELNSISNTVISRVKVEMSALTAISSLLQDSQDLSTGNRSTNSSPYILGVLPESYAILTNNICKKYILQQWIVLWVLSV